MFLRKYNPISGASRNITKITSQWFLRDRFNQLTWTRKSYAGRSNNGRIVLRSKGSITRRLRYPRINYNFRSNALIFVSTFYLVPFQNKLVALCFLASGGVTYLQSTTQYNNFTFFKGPYRCNSRILKIMNPTVSMLMRIKLQSKVSLVELFPGSGVQYVRSAGCSARFFKIDLHKHTAVLILPSGIQKAFSLYSVGSIGAVSLRLKRLVRNTKSGFWRSFGLKARTRGVAKNPIDHPHGGRTKAIKNHRTPWGKPTKLK